MEAEAEAARKLTASSSLAETRNKRCQGTHKFCLFYGVLYLPVYKHKKYVYERIEQFSLHMSLCQRSDFFILAMYPYAQVLLDVFPKLDFVSQPSFAMSSAFF